MKQDTQSLVDKLPAYFLDFEASSLDEDSWPIEIGIARVRNRKVATDSRLIRPEPDWNPDAWSSASEKIHGISRETLRTAGIEATKVAMWFKEQNTGIAITDNPEFERRWLIKLLGAHPPFPLVRLLDFDSYVKMSLPDAAAVSRCFRALEASRPQPHRAGPDAARLASAWLAGAHQN